MILGLNYYSLHFHQKTLNFFSLPFFCKSPAIFCIFFVYFEVWFWTFYTFDLIWSELEFSDFYLSFPDLRMTLGLLLGIGRTFRRKRASSLDILSPKRAPRDFYKGKNCKPTGFHTRKGWFHFFLHFHAFSGYLCCFEFSSESGTLWFALMLLQFWESCSWLWKCCLRIPTCLN